MPEGSSPDASSNDVACRRLRWIFSRCCLGVVPFVVDLSPFCVGLDYRLISPTIGNMSLVYLSIFALLRSSPR